MDRKEHTVQKNSQDEIVNVRIHKKRRLIYLILSLVAYILSIIFLHYFFGQAMAISAVIPVIVVGWLYGYKAGILFALFCFPANIFFFALFGVNWWEKMILSGGGVTGTLALVLIGAIVGRMSDLNTQLKEALYKRKQAEEEREKIIQELQDALADVKKLSGLLPICGSCKKIREDSGYWTRIEKYIKDHSEADFSHSICPECMKRRLPEFPVHNKKKIDK
jgi:hypothetical protein